MPLKWLWSTEVLRTLKENREETSEFPPPHFFSAPRGWILFFFMTLFSSHPFGLLLSCKLIKCPTLKEYIIEFRLVIKGPKE